MNISSYYTLQQLQNKKDIKGIKTNNKITTTHICIDQLLEYIYVFLRFSSNSIKQCYNNKIIL